MLFTSLAIALAAASSVRAHGYVQDVKVGGKTYPAWHPFEDPYASPVPKTIQRKVADDGPVNFDAAELTCNKGGNRGNGASATIAAGQTVKWTMNRWPEDHHGPISVYMANCNGDCNSFSGSGKSWFKLSSTGLIDAKSFKWASDKLITDGNSWTATVPSNIKAGNYLMRLELLALHSAGQPQLYPSCTQLKVTGGGDGAPTNAELVSIPGVYKSGDQALFGDIWGSPKSWPQVGPNVAAFVSGGSSDPAPAPAPPKASDPAPSPSSKPTSKYSEAQPEPATTSKTASGSAPTKSSKVCRHKAKTLANKSGHSAKRNYVRGLGKNRL